MLSTDRDVVYAVAVSMAPASAAPFISSFRRHNVGARIVIGIGRGESAAWEQAREQWQVETREIGSRFRVRRWRGSRSYGVLQILSRAPLLRRGLLAAMGTSSRRRAERLRSVASVTMARFCWYYLWLEQDNPRRVLIGDVRDVIFQADPFDDAYAWGEVIHTGQENMLIRDNALNRRWIGLTGRSASPLLDRPIICSGVTMGTRGAVERYLEQMIDVMATSDSLIDGVDQAIHNLVVHTRLDDAATSVNGAGPIYTAGFVAEGDATIVNGTLRNDDGSVVPIVHQYDRWSDAFQRRLYAVASDPSELDQLSTSPAAQIAAPPFQEQRGLT